jgi:hypothetical protein
MKRPRVTPVQESLEALRMESFAIATSKAQDRQDKTQTGATYATHVRRYESWWMTNEAQKQLDDEHYTPIPHRPITATKVFYFMVHELQRTVCIVLMYAKLTKMRHLL